MFNDEDGNPPLEPRQAGPGVRGLLRDREFLNLMSMSRLFPESQAGGYGKQLACNAHSLRLFAAQDCANRSIPSSLVPMRVMP